MEATPAIFSIFRVGVMSNDQSLSRLAVGQKSHLTPADSVFVDFVGEIAPIVAANSPKHLRVSPPSHSLPPGD
jgi:hypothetical protein